MPANLIIFSFTAINFGCLTLTKLSKFWAREEIFGTIANERQIKRSECVMEIKEKAHFDNKFT